jgi:predicted AlkP superfamily pyrophosphatase or phosphodiesterase
MPLKRRRTLLSLALLLLLCACATRDVRTMNSSGGINAPEHLDKPYLVLVSLDGFRWDYPERYQPPAIRQIIKTGFRAERLVPVFPAVTFPNHYSVATGLFPDRHGIVANDFYAPEFGAWYRLSDRDTVEDGRFYGGEPIWVTAERQGMVSAAFFFVGTEADIRGVHPTHWRPFSKAVAGERRVDQVVSWLSKPKEYRPHLVTLYFSDVDDHSHWSGEGSVEAQRAVARVDEFLGRLMRGLAGLPHADRVNVIVVSDHGQASYVPEPVPLVLEEHIDLADIRVVGKGSYSFLYYRSPDRTRVLADQALLRSAWQHGRVLRPEEAPPDWRVGKNARWPELMLVPDDGHMVVARMEQIPGLKPGTHGWAPEFEDMHGVLLGTGPAFRAGATTGPAHVVDVYPLLLRVLGLEGPGDVDGDPGVLQGVLAPD